MEFNIVIDTTDNYAKVITSGHIDVSGIAGTLDAIVSDVNWNPGMNLVVDYSDSSTIDLNSEKVSAISHLVKAQKERLGSGKMAIVMTSDLDYGYARMFQLLTEDYIDKEINVYRDSESAIKWIFTS